MERGREGKWEEKERGGSGKEENGSKRIGGRKSGFIVSQNKHLNTKAKLSTNFKTSNSILLWISTESSYAMFFRRP